MDKAGLGELIRYENPEMADKAVSEGRSTFFLSGHFANWELTAFSYSRLYGRSLKIIAKEQASKMLNRKINKYRELGGNEIIQTGFSLRAVYEKIKLNDIICFLVDQSANPDYSVYVKFFGKITATFSGPARIALKKRPVLLTAHSVRQKDYSYILKFDKIEYDDIEDFSEENIKLLTQRIQNKFEEIITANPGMWLWLHRRFKHMKESEDK